MYCCLIAMEAPYKHLAAGKGATPVDAIRAADAQLHRMIHAPVTVKVFHGPRQLGTLTEYTAHMAVLVAVREFGGYTT